MPAQSATPRKLGLHHFAMLRAVSEGVDPVSAADRYLLEADSGRVAAKRAYQGVLDQVRSLARRNGDPRWRLIGLQLRESSGSTKPALAQWAEEQGLEDFSQAEQLELYEQAFPADRKQARTSRLRAKQLDVLKQYESTAAEPAKLSDRIDAWIPEPHASRLLAAGMLTLADLQERIQAGGRWWSNLPKIGAGKASRIAQQLELMIPGSTLRKRSSVIARAGAVLAKRIAEDRESKEIASSNSALLAIVAGAGGLDVSSRNIAVLSASEGGAASGSTALTPELRAPGIGFVLSPRQLEARDIGADSEAVRAWIRAKAGSHATVKVYRRELSRFLLFLQSRGVTMTTCTADDCLAYQALLAYVPPEWIGKRQTSLADEAWSPFAGQLKLRSQQQAVAIINSCFSWLVSARYLVGNPWMLVNRRTGDDPTADQMASRAIEPQAWAEILGYLRAESRAHPAAARMLFLAEFLEATGLRAAEMLGARVGDIRYERSMVLLQVHGKGSKNRLIPLTGQALRALSEYLHSRGLSLDSAPPMTPLVASIEKPDEGIAYRVLYESMKLWISRAIAGSRLTIAEKVKAGKASPHWLRHTCGTRALERGVPLDVVGQLLGHSDPRTTAKYTRAHIRRVSEELEKAFG